MTSFREENFSTAGLSELEEKLCYHFRDDSLLEMALTHSSYNKEKNTRHQDNERLEFLGDALLDAIVGEELFRRLPQGTEGRLTKTRALVVCERSLAAVAAACDLGDYLYLGHGEELAGGRQKPSILADALEAVIGAMFLDAGYDAARAFVLRSFAQLLKKAEAGQLFSDYKSEVQELMQKLDKHAELIYSIEREEGPAHDKTFYVSLSCRQELLGRGSGKSKKEAEQNAARAAIETLKRRKEIDVL